MAFTALNSSEVAAGEPTKQELFNKIRLNFDDHESRLLTVEGATNAYLSIDFGVQGEYGVLGTQTNISGYIRIPFNLTILSGRLLIEQAGSAGTTEVDMLFKRGVSAFSSLFTTRPSVAFSAGSNALSTNGVLDATKVNLLAGDIIRCDLTASQTGGKGFVAILEFEKT